MRKIIGFIFASIIVTIAFSACNNDETYADKLKNEEKAIDRFIKDRGIVVLNTFPSDTVFAENEFYRDEESGIYVRVINKGNTSNMASKTNPQTQVLFRFYDTELFATEDTVKYSNNTQMDPFQFVYGDANTYNYADYSSDYSKYLFLSPGCAFPLEYVGEMGEVSVIVPFANGSSYQQGNYQPIYYGRIQYTKFLK